MRSRRMSKVIDVGQLEETMKSVGAIQFSLIFGSGRTGHLPKIDSDIDVAVYLDHKPDLDERLHLLGSFRTPSRRIEWTWCF
jgi:hypothetical protein